MTQLSSRYVCNCELYRIYAVFTAYLLVIIVGANFYLKIIMFKRNPVSH